MFIPTQAYVQQWMQSFKEFPPRQKPSTFGVEELSNAIYQMTGKE
jgi:arylsulfatase